MFFVENVAFYSGYKTKRPDYPDALRNTQIYLAALDGQEAVAWVFVHAKASWKLTSFWTVVLTEVVNSLLFAATKCDFL